MANGSEVTATISGNAGPLDKAVAAAVAQLRRQKIEADKLLTYDAKLAPGSLARIRSEWSAFTSKLAQPLPMPKLPPIPRVDQAGSFASRVPMAAGGTRGMTQSMQLGQASLQIQDVIVQAQMGTKASTILLQQGTQLLSSFGPKGDIIAGVLAMGGAFVAASMTGRRSLDGLRTSLAELDKDIQGIASNGNMDQISAGLGRIAEARKEINSNNSQDFWGRIGGMALGGVAGAMKGAAGGPGGMVYGSMTGASEVMDAQSLERQNETQNQLAKNENQRLTLERQLRTISDQEAEAGILRANGQEREADAMERKIALAKQIRAIEEDPNLNRTGKAVRIQNLESVDAALDAKDKRDVAAEQKDKDDKTRSEWRAAEEQTQKRLDDGSARAKQGAEQLQVLEFEAKINTLPLEGQLDAITARIDQVKANAAAERDVGPRPLVEEMPQMREVADLENQGRRVKEAIDDKAKDNQDRKDRVKLAQKEWDLDQKIKGAIARSGVADSPEVKALQDEQKKLHLTEQFKGQGMSEADAAAKADITIRSDNAADAAIKRQTQGQSLQEIESNAAINDARAHGHTRKAERMESQAGEDAKTKQLMDLGMSEPEARKKAGQMQRSEDKIAGRRGSIKGVKSSTDWGLDSQRTPTLDAWKANAGTPIKAQTPALDAMAKRQAAANAAAGKAQPQGRHESLLAEIKAEIVNVVNKLNFAN